MSTTIDVEDMIAYVRREHMYLDWYYVVDKSVDWGLFCNAYRIPRPAI